MLYLLYDDHCGLCSQLKQWLMKQKLAVPLCLVCWDSDQARQMFPTVVTSLSASELTVISNGGEVWRNEKAWLMVLHALVRYQTIARKLATPALLPFARQAFLTLSYNRHILSSWLRLSSETAVAERLGRIEVPACELPRKG